MAFANGTRSQVSSYVSPEEDLIFWEIHDAVLPKNRKKQWVYGQEHKEFKDFILVFVEPHKTEGKQVWYYASKRCCQDEYNFEWADADIGGTKFKSIVRTYIFLREEEFNPDAPLMGSPMPNVPKGKFSGGDEEPEFLTDWSLAERLQKKTEDQRIDSKFIMERRTYVKRCTIRQINMDDELGEGFSESTDLYYKGQLIGGVPVEDLFADPGNAFWALQEDGSIRKGDQLSCNWYAVVTTSSIDAFLLSWKRQFPGRIDLDLPDVLNSVGVLWNKGEGGGNSAFDYNGVARWSGDIKASLSAGESANGQGSSSLQPELAVRMTSPNGRGVRCTFYTFYMQLTAGTISDSDLSARLNTLTGQTVLQWPIFKPQAHVITLRGQKVSLSAQASANGFVSANEGGESTISKALTKGKGLDKDVSTMNGTTRIPPTIHGEIIISDVTESANVSASCEVQWISQSTHSLLGLAVEVPPVSESASVVGQAVGSVSPSVLPATSPSSIPSTGYYSVDIRISPTSRTGWMLVTVAVINAADL